MKLKDYKYQINGVDTHKPALDCLLAIASGITIPLIISLIIVWADYIDEIENFGLAFLLISSFFASLLYLFTRK